MVSVSYKNFTYFLFFKSCFWFGHWKQVVLLYKVILKQTNVEEKIIEPVLLHIILGKHHIHRLKSILLSSTKSFLSIRIIPIFVPYVDRPITLLLLLFYLNQPHIFAINRMSFTTALYEKSQQFFWRQFCLVPGRNYSKNYSLHFCWVANGLLVLKYTEWWFNWPLLHFIRWYICKNHVPSLKLNFVLPARNLEIIGEQIHLTIVCLAKDIIQSTTDVSALGPLPVLLFHGFLHSPSHCPCSKWIYMQGNLHARDDYKIVHSVNDSDDGDQVVIGEGKSITIFDSLLDVG